MNLAAFGMGARIVGRSGVRVCPLKGVQPMDLQPQNQKLSYFDYSVLNHTIHVALVFDVHATPNALAIMRSMMSVSLERLHFHLVVPQDVEKAVRSFPMTPREDMLTFYDYEICTEKIQVIEPLVASGYHRSGLCKLFLADILPPHVTRVLVTDTDITAVQDFSKCYNAEFSDTQLIGMAHDTGDACVLYPDQCWPIGFDTETPPGLHCKNLKGVSDGMWPWRSLRLLFNPVCRCENERSCYREPVVFNGGVMLMDLAKMRSRKFIEDFVAVSISTFTKIDRKQARWGEQCLLNNYFRVQPQVIHDLPCGCNYQYWSKRKEIWCAQKPVYFAHGWKSGVKKETSNPYNHHWYYFRGSCSQCCGKPLVPTISAVSADGDYSYISRLRHDHDKNCSHQNFDCRLQGTSSV